MLAEGGCGYSEVGKLPYDIAIFPFKREYDYYNPILSKIIHKGNGCEHVYSRVVHKIITKNVHLMTFQSEFYYSFFFGLREGGHGDVIHTYSLFAARLHMKISKSPSHHSLFLKCPTLKKKKRVTGNIEPILFLISVAYTSTTRKFNGSVMPLPPVVIRYWESRS